MGFFPVPVVIHPDLNIPDRFRIILLSAGNPDFLKAAEIRIGSGWMALVDRSAKRHSRLESRDSGIRHLRQTRFGKPHSGVPHRSPAEFILPF